MTHYHFPDDVLISISHYTGVTDMLGVCRRWRVLIGLSPLTSHVQKLSRERLLSHRRSKGLLWTGKDTSGALFVVRTINLEFYNSGVSDGVPSSVLREICLLKGFSHPNLVSVLSAEFHGKSMLSIIFPYYERSLRDVINNENMQSVLSFEKITSIFCQLCRGASFIHRHGIIHRNIRPENILIDQKGYTIKLSDFSSCRRSHPPFCVPRCFTPEEPKNRTRTVKEISRLNYRAPELLMRSEKYSTEIDVWSLGVVLLEMSQLNPSKIAWFNTPSGSEAEVLLEVFKICGSPTLDVWPEAPYQCKLWSPRYPAWKGSLQEFENSDFLKTFSEAGRPFVPLLRTLLRFPPDKRPSAQKILCELSTVPNLLVSPTLPFTRFSLQTSRKISYSFSSCNFSQTFLNWIFSIGKLMDAPSWCVWAAVKTAEVFMSSSSRAFPVSLVLAACLKISHRLDVSRDFYKLNTCERIVASVASEIPHFSVSGLIEVEREILTVLKFCVEIPERPNFQVPISSKFKMTDQDSFIPPLLLLVCDSCLVMKPPIPWDSVISLAPTITEVWSGKFETNAFLDTEFCEIDDFEENRCMQEIIQAISSMKKFPGSCLVQFHSLNSFPPIPSPSWSIEDAIKIRKCSLAQQRLSDCIDPMTSTPPPAKKTRRLTTLFDESPPRLSFPGSARRTSLSSDRRRKLRPSNGL